MTESSRTLETLLAEASWIAGLARALVHDPNSADDAAQATWVDVLRTPPTRLGNARAWLATALRRHVLRRARGERRRRAHENAAVADPVAEPRAALAADDAAARLETHRALVAAVSELPEPYRTAIVLRFFEQLDVAAIGARTGSPANTVRSQLQRGVHLLRERLDRAPGGRERWLAAVGVLARPRPAAALVGAGATLGIALLPMKKTLLVAAGAALSVSLAWPLLTPGSAPPAPAVDGPARASDAAVAAAVAPARSSAAPTALARTEAPATPPPTPPAPGATGTRVVVGRDGAPLAGVAMRAVTPFVVRWQGGDRGWIRGERSLRIDADEEARLRRDPAHAARFFAQFDHPEEWRATVLGEPIPEQLGLSGPDGSFTFAPGRGDDDAAIEVGDARYVLLAQGRTGERPWRVGPATRVHGVVRDEQGAPLADAFVVALTPDDGGRVLPEAVEVRTDAGGRFLVRRALAGGLLAARRDGFASGWATLGDGAEQEVEIVLRQRAAGDRREIDGLVVDGAGRPIGGAMVWFGRQRTKAGADGRFALAVNEPRPQYALTVVAPGWAPLQRDDFGAELAATASVGRDLLLVLDRRPVAFRGVVLGSDGQPLANARIGLVDPTLLDVSFRGIEDLLGDRDGDVATGADGSFALGGLVDRPYRLRAVDPGTGAVVVAPPQRPGDVVLRLPADLRRGVRGEVRSGGAPVAGATVEVAWCQHVTKGGGTRFESAAAVACDERGRFVLPALPRRGAWVLVRVAGAVRDARPVETMSGQELVVDLNGPRWLQLIGSAHPTTRPVALELADGRVTSALTPAGDPLTLAADGSSPPIALPTQAVAVWIDRGGPAARRVGTDRRPRCAPPRAVTGRAAFGRTG